MDATTAAVGLITRFEGRRLTAYKDPAGVPTIGYGTTIYPTGAKVRIGDSISAEEATEFLAVDLASFTTGLTASLHGVTVNQNQFDALVSFTYNVGLGAFADSTLLRKLRAGDAVAAGAQFPRWNKATVKGVKKVLPGLVKRRAAERALFEAAPAADSGDLDTTVGAPAQPDPASATIFDDAGVTVVALADGAQHVVELLALADRKPATLRALLAEYPTLTTVAAAAGAPIPAGPRLTFALDPPPVPPVTDPPTLNRPLLALGSVDGPKFPGRDVHQLQARLKDLGYYDGPASGTFDAATDDAAKSFQADYFGPAQADGRVGKKTWRKLFPKAPTTTGRTMPSKPGVTYLRLTMTQKKSGRLVLLKLAFVKDGRPAGDIRVYSGTGAHQVFRIGTKSRVGSNEPIPEGRWRIGDIQWRDGADNYQGKVWNQGLGPVKTPLGYQGPGSTPRGAIEIHIDWNAAQSPGTAGCVGVRSRADYKTLVGWLRETNPRDLYVDWGLGTCPELP